MKNKHSDKIDDTILDAIRIIPDFPKKGIKFADITPMLGDNEVFALVIQALFNKYHHESIDYVVATESRGFIFGAPLAHRLGAGFVPVRKKGKLPSQVLAESYLLEYGVDTVEIHADSIPAGKKVLIIDDLLATGGTALATAKLVRRLDAKIVDIAFIIELKDLNGGKTLGDNSLTHTSLLKM